MTYVFACVVHVGSASGTPPLNKEKGAMTPSSGQVKTPASAGWKTPTSSAGRVASQQGVGGPLALAFGTPPALTKSGTPSKVPALSTRTSDDSILFPENEEICLSQAQELPNANRERGQKEILDTVVPETLPEEKLGIVDDDADTPDTRSTENILLDKAVSDGKERETSPPSKGVYELALPDTEFQSLEGDTGSPEINAHPESPPSTEKAPRQGTAPQRSARVAALRNTLCPSPGAALGGTSDAGREAATKKLNLGRGRGTQSAARAEKQCNMKPLASFGLQEKFKAPAVVSDAGKGRGRGGKPAKRKRDGGT